MILTRKQEEAVRIGRDRYRAGEKCTVIGGYAGTGKAQPNTTLIPTPNGYKQLGDLKIGDYVYDRKGNPTKVIGVYPQGKIDSYTVYLSDGRQTRCNNEHLWTYYTSRGNFATKTLQQIIDSGLRKARGFKFQIPCHSAINYKEKEYIIDPYVVGVFLGDGCCLQKLLTLSSSDEELVTEIGRLINAVPRKNSDKNYNWSFILNEEYYNEETKRYSSFAHTDVVFKGYEKELVGDCYTKRIPKEYFYGSIEQRLSLLQGLMDTDGSITFSEGRFNIRYTSVNKELIDDIREILWSLGYSNTVSIDKRPGKYKITGCSYNININIPNEEKHKLFRLTRKKNLALQAIDKPKHRCYDRVSIVDIKKNEFQEEMTCIMVDNSEHLYLTNDYIVTHNTTTLSHIIEAININPEEIAYATFTGKAALVLRQKGFNAQTLHKLLYDTQKIGNHFVFRAKRKLDKPYKIVVVDELSMVPMTLMRLLAKHNVHVIGLGDPFQLPPIADDNLMLNNPHIFLDEVMRQAQESEILRLSMDIREGKPLQLFNGNELKVIDKKDIVDGMYLWADAIICGRNNTRRQINHKVRGMRGATSLTPEEGDKLVCLRNYWESESEVSFDPMINGMIGYAHNIGTPCEATGDIPLYFQPDYLNEGDGFKVSSDCNIFNWQDPREEDVPYNGKIIKPGIELDYGYAITCHKSQGSEFDKIMVLEENINRTNHLKWLYTAVTRAKERAIVVRNY